MSSTDSEKIYKTGGNQKKYHTTYVQTFFCHIPDRRRRGYQLRAADIGTQFHKNDADIHPYRSEKTGRNPARAASEKQDENSRSSIKNDNNSTDMVK